MTWIILFAYLPAGGRGAVQQPLLQPHAAVNTVSQQTGIVLQHSVLVNRYNLRPSNLQT